MSLRQFYKRIDVYYAVKDLVEQKFYRNYTMILSTVRKVDPSLIKIIEQNKDQIREMFAEYGYDLWEFENIKQCLIDLNLIKKD